MTLRDRGYLGALSRRLHLAPHEQEEIINELRDHIEDKTRELVEAGAPREEALKYALNDLGASDGVAEDLYEVHSRGSWHHTALAVLPHILLSLMFALHLWRSPGWVIPMLILAVAMSVFGWKMGRPKWTYPWLGYCLMAPVVSWGLALSAVGYGAWGVVAHGSLPLSIPIYAASFIYIAISLWMVIRFVSKVARPDWIMASLSMLPIPFLAFWLLYFYNGGGEVRSARQSLQHVDTSAAVVFLLVALTTAIFYRIGRRLVRVALLVITAPSMVILAWLSYQGGPGFVGVFLISAVSLAVLLSPALFDTREDSLSEGSAETMEQTAGGRPA